MAMAQAPATVPYRMSVETKDRIAALKIHPRETIEDVLRRLLDERESAERTAPK